MLRSKTVGLLKSAEGEIETEYSLSSWQTLVMNKMLKKKVSDITVRFPRKASKAERADQRDRKNTEGGTYAAFTAFFNNNLANKTRVRTMYDEIFRLAKFLSHPICKIF